MNTVATADPSTARPGKRSEAGAAEAAQAESQHRRQQQRQLLLREECVKRGLRFLPEQVMRPIYERAGLL